MATRTSIVGKTYPEQRFTIDREHAERFASALGTDLALGVPPTYAAVYALGATIPDLFVDEEAAIDFSHLVHGEQEFSWTRQPTVGETVVAQGTVLEDNERRGMRFVTFETVCRDEGGDEVCRSRMLSIIRSAS